MEYYADAEGGDYVQDPDHAEVLSLIKRLNTTTNTFVVLYPTDHDLEWFISVATSRGPFGGYEVERYDPTTGEKAKTTSAAPGQIATDVLAWVTQR
ncbi:hypothetical protein ACIA03_08070 [Nocardioides sp. NPDC051685]|uniref:hypothetical protein n=1 Tax=Nocardioides sp. NPDC051685 TaxID=3364334 RepID=UPI0037B01984